MSSWDHCFIEAAAVHGLTPYPAGGLFYPPGGARLFRIILLYPPA